jgi:hypothetical protein
MWMGWHGPSVKVTRWLCVWKAGTEINVGTLPQAERKSNLDYSEIDFRLCAQAVTLREKELAWDEDLHLLSGIQGFFENPNILPGEGGSYTSTAGEASGKYFPVVCQQV